MTGRHHVGDGVNAHPWVDALAEGAADLDVRFPTGMPEPIQQLMATLGVKVIFDESLPRDYAAASWKRRLAARQEDA